MDLGKMLGNVGGAAEQVPNLINAIKKGDVSGATSIGQDIIKKTDKATLKNAISALESTCGSNPAFKAVKKLL